MYNKYLLYHVVFSWPVDTWSEWCLDEKTKRQKDKKDKKTKKDKKNKKDKTRQNDKKTKKTKKPSRQKDKKLERQKTKTKKRVWYCDVRAVSHSCDVFMCYHRRWHRERMMVSNVTITIGAIICAQPLELIIFRWLSIIGPAMRLYRCIVQV